MYITNIVFTALVLGLVACSPSGGAERWTGVVAVKESSKVWQLYDKAGGPNERFVQLLEQGLQNGTVEPATGTFEFRPYANGRPIADAYEVQVRPEHQGTWYFRGPARFFRQGQAMCVEVPPSWDGIAAHNRFPAAANQRTNCTPDIIGPVGLDRHNALTVPVVHPAG